MHGSHKADIYSASLIIYFIASSYRAPLKHAGDVTTRPKVRRAPPTKQRSARRWHSAFAVFGLMFDVGPVSPQKSAFPSHFLALFGLFGPMALGSRRCTPRHPWARWHRAPRCLTWRGAGKQLQVAGAGAAAGANVVGRPERVSLPSASARPPHPPKAGGPRLGCASRIPR